MMEQLRVIPVFMFLAGIVLVYSGFKGQAPLDIIRNNLGSLGDDNVTATESSPYTPAQYGVTSNPYYVGVAYTRPGTTLGPRLYS